MVTLSEQRIEPFNPIDEAQRPCVLNFARILSGTPVIKGKPGAGMVAATGFFYAQSAEAREALRAAGCED
jgi:hypothetical protein